MDATRAMLAFAKPLLTPLILLALLAFEFGAPPAAGGCKKLLALTAASAPIVAVVIVVVPAAATVAVALLPLMPLSAQRSSSPATSIADAAWCTSLLGWTAMAPGRAASMWCV